MLLCCCLLLCAQTKHISVSDSRSAIVAVVLSRFVCTNQTHLCECQRCCVVSFPVPKPNASVCDCECLCHSVVVSFPVHKPNTCVCNCECQCRFVVSIPVPKPNASLCVTLRVPLLLCCCLILRTQTKHISVCDSVSASVAVVLSHSVYTNQTHL